MMKDFLSHALGNLALASRATDADPRVHFWLRRLSAYHDTLQGSDGRDPIEVLGNTYGATLKRKAREFFFEMIDEYEEYRRTYDAAAEIAEADAKRAVLKAKIAALPPSPPGFPSFQFPPTANTSKPDVDLLSVSLEYGHSEDPYLVCPLCKGANMHQEEVNVYQRTGEDAEEGICVSVQDAEARVGLDMELNPSARRDGLLITFSCESCSADAGRYPQLALFQHKGTTYLKWQRVFNQRS